MRSWGAMRTSPNEVDLTASFGVLLKISWLLLCRLPSLSFESDVLFRMKANDFIVPISDELSKVGEMPTSMEQLNRWASSNGNTMVSFLLAFSRGNVWRLINSLGTWVERPAVSSLLAEKVSSLTFFAFISFWLNIFFGFSVNIVSGDVILLTSGGTCSELRSSWFL